MRKSVRANLLLLLTAMIWGVAFVAQDVASDSLEPFIFNGLRMGLAGLALLPVVLWMERKAAREGTADVENTGGGVPFLKMTFCWAAFGAACCWGWEARFSRWVSTWGLARARQAF